MTLITPLLMSMAIFLTYWFVTRTWGFHLVNRILAVSILTILEIIITELVLGLGKTLMPFWLLVLNTSIILFILIWGFTSRQASHLQKQDDSIPRPSSSDVILFIPVAVVYGFIAFLNTIIPPYDWDSLTYHLVDVLFYAQEKAVGIFPYPSHHYFFPKVGELLTLWIYLLGGRDSIAYYHLNIVQAPFAILGGLAIVSSSHSLGFKKGTWISLPLFALTPIVMIQSLTTMVDLIAGSLFLITLAFLLSFLKTRKLLFLQFACLSLGLLFGTKFKFLYLFLPVIPILIFSRMRVILTLSYILRPKWKNLSILFVCIMLGCGFWLIRNTIWLGNPFYPAEITVGHHILFEGPPVVFPEPVFDYFFVQTPSEWAVYPLIEKMKDQLIYSHENGFGPQFLLGLICSVWGIFIAYKRNNRMVFWTLFSIPLLIMLWIYPNPFHFPRYLIPLCGLAILGLNFLIEIGERSLRLCLLLIAWISVLFSVIASIGVLAPHEALAIRTYQQTGNPPPLAQYYRWEYKGLAESWEWFLKNENHGETIAFANNQLIAPLFGLENKNRLVWISPPEKPLYLNILHARNYSEWRSLLQQEEAHLLYLLDLKEGKQIHSRIIRWVKEHPSNFQLIKNFLSFPYITEIYRIIYKKQNLQEEEKFEIAFKDLDRIESWSIAYEENSKLTLHKVMWGMGLILECSFNTPNNDYAEAVAYPDETDWERFKSLSFRLYQEDLKDILYIYLKNSNPKEYERFYIPMADLQTGWNLIELPLKKPERKSNSFSLKNVNSIHLVMDDDPDSRVGSGTIEIREFQGIPNSETGSSKR